jgi:hypothetical protein
MKILLPIAAIVAVLLVYVLWGRDWLKKQSWAQGFFAFVEPIEIFLYKKSETILFGRLLTGLGAVLTLLTQVGSIDITPLMPFVPEKYHAFVQFVWNLLPLTISALGMIVEKLRNSTTKPLELVAVPEVGLTPEVKVAIAQADETKEWAVSVVKDKVI